MIGNMKKNLNLFFSALKRSAMMYGENGFWFIIEGVLINSALVLSTGAFLTGFFVELNANDFIVGFVGTANIWAPVTALFSCYIYAKLKKTKRFLILSNILSRILLCGIVFLPVISPNSAGLAELAMIIVIVGNILWSIYCVGANIWMMTSVSRTDRTEFIYKRMLWLRISYTLTSLIMGFVLDRFTDRLLGFILVFMLSFLLSIMDIVVLIKIPYGDTESKGVNTMVPTLLLAPFRHREYRRFLLFTLLYYLIVYTSFSFSNLYLLRYLEFPYIYLSIVYTVFYVAQIFSALLWRAIEKKKGAMFVFRCSALSLLVELFLYTFLMGRYAIIPLTAAIFAGFGTGGLNIIMFTYRYDIMPEDNSTNFETWFMVIQGLAIMLGPIIGGIVRPMLSPFSIGSLQLSEFQQMYFLSAVMAALMIPLFLKQDRSKGGVGSKSKTE